MTLNVTARSVLLVVLALCLICMASPPAAAQDKDADEAQPAVSQRAGYVPNAFTDSKMDAPLLKTQNVYDLYGAVVDYLQEAYPKDAPAGAALEKFKTFVSAERDNYLKDPASARPYRMPMSIDVLMKHLNAGADKDGSPVMANLGDNVKAQLYASALLPLVHLRGITYRIRPMVGESFVLHSMAINSLRGLKQSLDVMSGANGRALFDFVTFPMSYGERTQVEFAKVSDLQSWLVTSFIPTLDHSIAIVEKVAASLPENFRESLNMEVFLKAERPFPVAQMESAYRWFGAPEVHQYLAYLYGARAALHAACAYNMDDYSDATNELSNTIIKGFFAEKLSMGNKPRAGTPASQRFQVLEKYKRLWTLKSGEQCALALADLRKSVEWYDKGMTGFFQATAGDNDSRMTLLRPVQATYREYEQKFAPQLRALVAGPATLTDYVGGASIDVDLPGFLSNPPADLKSFFPEKFDNSSKYIELQSAGDLLVYTNYDYGRPLSWKASRAADGWAKLFPNIRRAVDKNGCWSAPLTLYRDVSRTYVGAIAAQLLGPAIF